MNYAAELNRLCDERWPGGSRSANVELAEAVSDATGRSIDRQLIWRLRKGHVRKVDSDVRRALCDFFGVAHTELDDGRSNSVPAQSTEELRTQVRDRGLSVAGLRASDLSDQGRRDLERILSEAVEVLERERAQGSNRGER